MFYFHTRERFWEIAVTTIEDLACGVRSSRASRKGDSRLSENSFLSFKITANDFKPKDGKKSIETEDFS